LQVKLCDPRLSALSVVATIKALYKFTSFLSFLSFQHYHLSEIAVYLDGQQQHSLKPIQPNFELGQFVRAYNTLFSGTGKLNRDEGIQISRDEYDNSCTPSTSPPTWRQTTILAWLNWESYIWRSNVHTRFCTVTVITYADFDNAIELDRDRNLLLRLLRRWPSLDGV